MLLSYHFCFSFLFLARQPTSGSVFFSSHIGSSMSLAEFPRTRTYSQRNRPQQQSRPAWELSAGLVVLGRENHVGRFKKTQLLGAKKWNRNLLEAFLLFSESNNSKVVGKFVLCCFRNQFSNNTFLHFKHQTLSWVVECDRFVIISTSSRPRNNLYCVILGVLGLLNNFLWGCLHLDASSWIDHFVGFPSLLKKSLWKFLGWRCLSCQTKASNCSMFIPKYDTLGQFTSQSLEHICRISSLFRSIHHHSSNDKTVWGRGGVKMWGQAAGCSSSNETNHHTVDWKKNMHHLIGRYRKCIPLFAGFYTIPWCCRISSINSLLAYLKSLRV